jgi:hypothetical protein
MPTLRKLEQDEVEALKENGGKDSVRAAIAREYDALIADFVPGEYGELHLDEGENRTTVKSRLVAAAKRRNWTLELKRTKGPVVRFKVVEQSGETVGEEDLELAA